VLGKTAAELAMHFAGRMEDALRDASPAWHFWAHVQQFFPTPSAPAAPIAPDADLA